MCFKMNSGQIFLVIIVIIIIIFVWCLAIRNEENSKEEFENYIRDKLFQKNYIEKSINEKFLLERGQKLLICGINHWETIRTHWEFKIYNSVETFYRISPSENAVTEKFWYKIISSIPNSDNNIIISNEFQLTDTVWTKRSGVIYPRVYLISN